MTPKEKAKELFKKYSKGKDEHGWNLCEFDSCAKKCALIAVDEILNNFGSKVGDKTHYCNYMTIQYYEEVKNEIDRL
jgi:hypothetical protein